MKNILFISSTNLTSNPRILKEILLAKSKGISVTFLGFKIGNWSDDIDENMNLKKAGINCVYLDATRKYFFNWLISSLIEKSCKLIYPILKKNLTIVAYAHNKRSWLLNKYLEKNGKHYSLVNAHTLAAFFPAYKLAIKTKTKFSFDVEDFHPGETIYADIKNEKERRIFLLKKILQKAYYVSCAAPLIEETIRKQFFANNQSNLFTVNNFFSKNEFIEPTIGNREKIKFVWFSQNINAGRGLELFIPVLKKYQQQITLELIGKMDEIFFENYIKQNINWITITSPLPQKKLHEYLSSFDIGLAIDLSSADYNREIAITNKILTYFQSGIYIMATNTLAQQKFLQQHTNAGILVEQNESYIEKSIQIIIEKFDDINNAKKERFFYAKNFCWENESEKVINHWD